MTDELNPTSDSTSMNSQEARTPTGEIIDQGESPIPTPTPEPASEVKQDPVGAPETYADFTPLEGMEIDPKMLEVATPIFKELNLPQESAQKLIDLHNKLIGNHTDVIMQTIEAQRADWRKGIQDDPVLGKNIPEVKTEIGRIKDRLSPEVRTAFEAAVNDTGVGDHPAFVRALYELAKLVNEGTHVSGAQPSPHGQTKNGKASPPSLAAAMYPNLAQ